MQENESDTKLSSAVKESRTLKPTENELDAQSTSSRQPVSAKGVDCARVYGDATVSHPSVRAAGFKMASNKGINISSANLERAKRLFEEKEGQSPFDVQSAKRSHTTKNENGKRHGSMECTISNSNRPLASREKFEGSRCLLTPLQKADVTELCNLLEQADSQFEFTQFKVEKTVQQCQENAAASHQRAIKDLDPDFLAGIDFDDSFSSDAEKHLASTDEVNKENVCIEDAVSFSKHSSASSSRAVSTKPKNLYLAGHNETNNLKNKNPFVSGEGFKTAGGNVLRVSKKCLSKAGALFADLEKVADMDETCEQPQNSPDPQRCETDGKTMDQRSTDDDMGQFLLLKDDDSEFRGDDRHAEDKIQICSPDTRETLCSDRQLSANQSSEQVTKSRENGKMNAKFQSGFQLASGKGISVSAKAMQEANVFFRGCDVMDGMDGMSTKLKKCTTPSTGSVSKKNHSGFKKVQRVNISEESVRGCPEFENMNVESVANGVKVRHHEDVEINNNMLALADTVSLHGDSSVTATPLPSFSTSGYIGDGFCTASGKTVSVSADAIRKAKSLLDESDGNQMNQQNQKRGLRTGHVTRQTEASPPQNGGFQTARGKGVTISHAALKKAKTLLSEHDGIEDKNKTNPANTIHDPPERNGGFFGSSVIHETSIGGGFSTASGKKVSVSADAMTKAKSLFSRIDAVEDQIEKQSQKGHLTRQLKASPPQNGGFETASVISSAALKKAKDLLGEHDRLKDKNEIKPINDPPLHYPRPNSDNVFGSPVIDETSVGGGKKVSVSADAMTKAKDLLNESDIFGDQNKQQSQKVNSRTGHITRQIKAFPLQNGGFQTGTSKRVSVSSADCKKAKSLLSECDGPEGKNEIKLSTDVPIYDPPPKRSGFSAASGKRVSFSAEALQKARSLFSDIDPQIPSRSDSREADAKCDDGQKSTKQIHCAFTTAGGAKVHLSEKNLLKAKNLLKEFADECQDSKIVSSSVHTPNAYPSKVDLSKGTLNFNDATASEKEEIEEIACQVVTSSESDNLHDSLVKKRPSMMYCEINQTSNSEKSELTEESSLVNFQSLHLSGCTDTQQRVVAQEALDCAKALLEDEVLAGDAFTMTSENRQNNRKSSKASAEAQKGKGKRLMEVTDTTGQPPLKRRLLEDFDRIVDRPRELMLHPEKSCPSG
ncbi:hypothetical protein LDENG_00235620, partial [Lucifuga dentata]